MIVFFDGWQFEVVANLNSRDFEAVGILRVRILVVGILSGRDFELVGILKSRDFDILPNSSSQIQFTTSISDPLYCRRH
jgi:hypothetical protein